MRLVEPNQRREELDVLHTVGLRLMPSGALAWYTGISIVATGTRLLDVSFSFFCSCL